MSTVIKFALMVIASILISHIVVMGLVSFVTWENYVLTDLSSLDEAGRFFYLLASFAGSCCSFLSLGRLVRHEL